MKRTWIWALLLCAGCDKQNKPWEAPDVVINEFMASNISGLMDASGAFPDWVELYNNGDELVDLSPYTLTDDASQPQKWSFPAGIELEAGAYLIIFPDGDPSTTDELHASFRLSAAGEAIQLIGPASEDFPIVDALAYDQQTGDVSMARQPNGTGEWAADDTPTPGTANE